MKFLAKIREAYAGGSLEITLDSKISEVMNLKKGQIVEVDISVKKQ